MLMEERRWNLTDRERESRHVETIDRLANEKEELVAEVQRLREALRFYANDQHWRKTIVVADGTRWGRELPAPGSTEEMSPGGEVVTVTAINRDGGKRARQALEGAE